MDDFQKVRQHVSCIGGGLIGGGWVAYFLAQGCDVTAWDPAPDGEARLKVLVADAWPHLAALGLASDASQKRLTYADTLENAVKHADFIQESAPEELGIKQSLLQDIDAAAPEKSIIASSTSGLSVTQMQAMATRPERIVAGHPFNPSHLIPLVEVAGGEKTSDEAINRAVAFYESVGKKIVRMEREVAGFIANRLQEAIWREAVQMVNAEEATVEQIDDAIVNGPGIRWAIYGPFMTYHLAVKDGGMATLLERLKGGKQDSFTRAVMPPLTDELKSRLIEGCAFQQGERSAAQLMAERDRKIVSIRRALEEENKT